jgi:imidazolonepropionase
MHADRLLLDCRLATMAKTGVPYGAVEHGAILIGGGRILYAGPQAELPQNAISGSNIVERLDGRWVTPGLIDCHTHLIFAGNRVEEFEARLNGASYEAIAREGGGILSTVRATRAASIDDLVAGAEVRLARMIHDGLTTIEIKSGYGLDAESEMRMLSAARLLGRETGVRVHATYLGLHAVPPEYAGDRRAYVAQVISDFLPRVAEAGLCDSADAFLETIAFDEADVRAFFDAARARNIPVRLHADQLTNGHGAKLAAEYGARSADHLEHCDAEGAMALGRAGTVAVLLPGAFVHLGETQKPPMALFRQHDVAIAIATDCNPGTSPLLSPLAAMNLACCCFGLTPEETLAGMTVHAARALGLSAVTGTLEAGKDADIAVWEIESPAELSYWAGALPCRSSYAHGEPLYTA